MFSFFAVYCHIGLESIWYKAEKHTDNDQLSDFEIRPWHITVLHTPANYVPRERIVDGDMLLNFLNFVFICAQNIMSWIFHREMGAQRLSISEAQRQTCSMKEKSMASRKDSLRIGNYPFLFHLLLIASLTSFLHLHIVSSVTLSQFCK